MFGKFISKSYEDDFHFNVCSQIIYEHVTIDMECEYESSCWPSDFESEEYDITLTFDHDLTDSDIYYVYHIVLPILNDRYRPDELKYLTVNQTDKRVICLQRSTTDNPPDEFYSNLTQALKDVEYIKVNRVKYMKCYKVLEITNGVEVREWHEITFKDNEKKRETRSKYKNKDEPHQAGDMVLVEMKDAIVYEDDRRDKFGIYEGKTYITYNDYDPSKAKTVTLDDITEIKEWCDTKPSGIRVNVFENICKIHFKQCDDTNPVYLISKNELSDLLKTESIEMYTTGFLYCEIHMNPMHKNGNFNDVVDEKLMNVFKKMEVYKRQ